VLMRIENVAISGPIGTFQSSEALERGFCQRCGRLIPGHARSETRRSRSTSRVCLPGWRHQDTAIAQAGPDG
jgi:hypothetical protein